ncbi:MAG: hypothetical protein D6692_08180 [Planctomycetota bacterium]|nr:MAG: hypothetical protein D6692_08180 [Planctomycetota bacterium]
MAESARVTSIEALTEFRPALIRFGEEAQAALVSVGSNAAMLVETLRRERLPHWKREIRIRSEEAVRANTKLIQQTASESPRPSVDARKAYELAKRRVKEAEDKYEHTQRSIRALEKEIEQYRTAIQPMASIVRASVPKAVARIDRSVAALDAYTAAEHRPEEPETPAKTDTSEDTE